MAMKFNSLGFQFNEDLQAISILTALPPEWSTIRSIILNKSGKFTLQGTIDALIEHEISLQHQQENALMVQQGRKSRSPALPNSKSKGTERPKCANCQRPGHTIEWCWAEGGGAKGCAPKKRKSRADMKGKGRKETLANIARDNQSPSPPPAIYIMRADEDALISQDPSSSSNFAQLIVDSGASAHMCHNHSYFSSYQKLNPPKRIWIADN